MVALVVRVVVEGLARPYVAAAQDGEHAAVVEVQLSRRAWRVAHDGKVGRIVAQRRPECGVAAADFVAPLVNKPALEAPDDVRIDCAQRVVVDDLLRRKVGLDADPVVAAHVHRRDHLVEVCYVAVVAPTDVAQFARLCPAPDLLVHVAAPVAIRRWAALHVSCNAVGAGLGELVGLPRLLAQLGHKSSGEVQDAGFAEDRLRAPFGIAVLQEAHLDVHNGVR